MKQRVEREIPLVLGHSVRSAKPSGGMLRLVLDGAGGTHEIVTDHVIAATGFRINVQQLAFLGDPLRERVRTVAGMPLLSANFESSVRGLYFVGLASAPTFGPLMRFMLGAGFAARRVAGHVTRTALKERAAFAGEPSRIRAA